MNREDYILRVAESKKKYHLEKAMMKFEDKLKVIIELQKLDIEMTKQNPNRKSSYKVKKVWEISL